MAKSKTRPVKKREARPGQISKSENRLDALRDEWARNRQSTPQLLEPIDGRKMAFDAAMLFQVTHDPIFDAVQDALAAYGLDKGEPARSFNRLIYATDERWRNAPRAVEATIVAAKKRGRKAPLDPTCAEVAAQLGLDANSLKAAAKNLAKRVRAARRNGHAPSMDGDTGRRMIVKPLYDETLSWIPANGQEVPDTLFWRQKLYDGDISAYFVFNRPPKKSKT